MEVEETESEESMSEIIDDDWDDWPKFDPMMVLALVGVVVSLVGVAVLWWVQR
jgi:maltodextrin utilization protein YvdJ